MKEEGWGWQEGNLKLEEEISFLIFGFRLLSV